MKGLGSIIVIGLVLISQMLQTSKNSDNIKKIKKELADIKEELERLKTSKEYIWLSNFNITRPR